MVFSEAYAIRPLLLIIKGLWFVDLWFVDLWLRVYG